NRVLDATPSWSRRGLTSMCTPGPRDIVSQARTTPSPSRRRPPQCGVDDPLRVRLDLGEVLRPAEGLGVDLVLVLRPGGARGEPRGLGDDLQPADGGAVAGGLG